MLTTYHQVDCNVFNSEFIKASKACDFGDVFGVESIDAPDFLAAGSHYSYTPITEGMAPFPIPSGFFRGIRMQ